MRHITENGINLIKRFEALSLVGYDDGIGIPTVGYGHTGPEVKIGMVITEDEAIDLIRRDVMTAERAVLRYITRPLTDNQFNALVSFVFNAGAGALQHSTLRMRCNAGNDAAVPSQFNRYVFGGGRKLKGLVARRSLEANLYAA